MCRISGSGSRIGRASTNLTDHNRWPSSSMSFSLWSNNVVSSAAICRASANPPRPLVHTCRVCTTRRPNRPCTLSAVSVASPLSQTGAAGPQARSPTPAPTNTRCTVAPRPFAQQRAPWPRSGQSWSPPPPPPSLLLLKRPVHVLGPQVRPDTPHRLHPPPHIRLRSHLRCAELDEGGVVDLIPRTEPHSGALHLVPDAVTQPARVHRRQALHRGLTHPACLTSRGLGALPHVRAHHPQPVSQAIDTADLHHHAASHSDTSPAGSA